MPFSRYMELCLYHPELGYYSRAHGAVRQGRRLLHLERRACSVRPPAGAPVRGDVAHARLARAHRPDRTRSWPRICSPAMCSTGRPNSFPISRGLALSSGRAIVDPSRAPADCGLSDHLANGTAAIFPTLEVRRVDCRTLTLILFANEFFDALPVEIVDHRGAVRVGRERRQVRRAVRSAVACGTRISRPLQRSPRAGRARRSFARVARLDATASLPRSPAAAVSPS